jgi:hypothetical protein
VFLDYGELKNAPCFGKDQKLREVQLIKTTVTDERVLEICQIE